MTAPKLGTNFQIESYKHSGSFHRLWEENIILKSTETIVIGANDKTKVVESDGRTWITREPSVSYFHSKYWFNVICMIRENDIYYYCNISSPFLYESNKLKYIDYDLDVKIYPDMTYDLLDEDEYEEHKEQMSYPKELDKILKKNIEYLLSWKRQRYGPFSPDFIDEWYERYLTYR